VEEPEEELLQSKRVNPQSFVTSHQKEYNELIPTLRSLFGVQVLKSTTDYRARTSTYQSRNRGFSPYHTLALAVDGKMLLAAALVEE
jgi:hypothetical protein